MTTPDEVRTLILETAKQQSPQIIERAADEYKSCKLRADGKELDNAQFCYGFALAYSPDKKKVGIDVLQRLISGTRKPELVDEALFTIAAACFQLGDLETGAKSVVQLLQRKPELEKARSLLMLISQERDRLKQKEAENVKKVAVAAVAVGLLGLFLAKK